MDFAQVTALETRGRWLEWARTKGRSEYPSRIQHYEHVLEHGDSYFMNAKFCSLVDHARETVPDNLTFDSTWMQSEEGWLWVETPFDLPNQMISNGELVELSELPGGAPYIAAVGWYKYKHEHRFSCFVPHHDAFHCYSSFILLEGSALLETIHDFDEQRRESETYVAGHVRDMKHEIRWVYTAFYLMAQKLAVTLQQDTDRATRRRAERERRQITPHIRVITLRRMEAERQEAEARHSVDWHCQWEVRGHWRNQFYPAENVHKPKFIEAYIKGPEDKPIRHSGRLFVAMR